ncbi:hypothetical protein [Terrisporobacter mayombei]|uniref:hypothetical protein n=1 Tax=Terrisporobacter mayombei TaxID=1541 RepID=UPI002657D69A|nr:hypothetical protein [Terrisporobacter mayombei]MCC3668898.1 hypothetical protein [Terrisporobacter mayombei]
MDEGMFYYWKNVLENDEDIELKINDYVVHLAIVNQGNGNFINEWICCDTFNKLKSLVGYVILPSVQITRALLRHGDNSLCFDIMHYDETLDMLVNINNDLKLIEEYKKWYEKLEECVDYQYFNEMKSLTDKISDIVDYREGLLVEIELYEDIKSVDLELIDAYEKDGMIDILEDTFNFSISEIKNIFNNIDKNQFLLKRIIPILDNLNMI